MAQKKDTSEKKDTPESTQPKESKTNKTSRRTFGKQIGGALAALPVAKIMAAAGAGTLTASITNSALASDQATSTWNGAERFKAILPALGPVMQYMQMDEAQYAPVMAARLSADAQRKIDEAVKAAAASSGASEDQIVSWIDAFTSMGKPGLTSDIPLLASDCAANLNGTWELTSRFTGGVETATRSQIYCDMDPVNARGKQVITMVTEVNLFETAQPQTIILVAMADIQFTQLGRYQVIGTSSGIVHANFPGYENGLRTTDTFRLVRRGQNETMVGFPVRTEAGGTDSFARTLVEVGGDPGTIKFKLWGALATRDTPRTLDTVDTYALMSNRRPLVGGFEPIGDYFNRITKQGIGHLSSMAPSVLALRSACEHVPIPRHSRHA